MKSYVLGNKNESYRLEYQSKQNNYRPIDEVPREDLELTDNSVVLDAGCGTGIFCRYVAEVNIDKSIQIIGVDASEVRINEAKSDEQNSKFKNIKYEVQDIGSLNFNDETFDLIICRFVYEHISEICQKASDEFFRVLKPGGKIIAIDTDGILYNLESEIQPIKDSLKKIREADFNFDGYVCKKIPKYLIRAGFKQEDIVINPMPMLFFNKEDREYEKQLWTMRFKQVGPLLNDILGEENTKEFISLYLQELLNEEVFLYYSKFIFKAQKTINL